MSLTDAQVLEQLHIRKAKLTIELQRVNIAINAFQEVHEIDDLDLYEIIGSSGNSTGKMDLNAISEEMAIATLSYNPHATYDNKVLYVLGKIQQGTAKQIADYLMTVDTRVSVKDIEKIYNSITYITSRMYRAGKIDAAKSGKQNLYKLKN